MKPNVDAVIYFSHTISHDKERIVSGAAIRLSRAATGAQVTESGRYDIIQLCGFVKDLARQL